MLVEVAPLRQWDYLYRPEFENVTLVSGDGQEDVYCL